MLLALVVIFGFLGLVVLVALARAWRPRPSASDHHAREMVDTMIADAKSEREKRQSAVDKDP